jgi:anthranilate synthase component 2
MKLLIMDNYDSFTYNLVQMVDEMSWVKYKVKMHDKVLLDEVNEYDKILITPGPGLPKDYPILKKVILKYCKTKSILGICLGHQAIAQSFGAALFKQNIPAHGVTKEIIISDSSDYLFEGLPGEMNVGLYHSWAVSPKNFPDKLNSHPLKTQISFWE